VQTAAETFVIKSAPESFLLTSLAQPAAFLEQLILFKFNFPSQRVGQEKSSL
jgi:hypothetical protein